MRGQRIKNQSWVSAGSTIVDLHSPSKFGCLPYGDTANIVIFRREIGPAIPAERTVFATGSNSTAGPDTPPSISTGSSHRSGTWLWALTFPTATTRAIPLLCCYRMVTCW